MRLSLVGVPSASRAVGMVRPTLSSSSFTKRASDRTITHSCRHSRPRTGGACCTFIVLVVAAHPRGRSYRIHESRCRHAEAGCLFLSSSPSLRGSSAELFNSSSFLYTPAGKRRHQHIRHRLRRRPADKHGIQRVQLRCRRRSPIGRGSALIFVVLAGISAVACFSDLVLSAQQKGRDCGLFILFALTNAQVGDDEAVYFGLESVPI